MASEYQKFFNQTDATNAKPYQSYNGQLNASPNDGQNLGYVNAINNSQSNPYQMGPLNQILAGSQNV